MASAAPRQLWGDRADVAVPAARGADGRTVEARALLAVLEAAGAAVALVDRDGRVQAATPAFERQLAAAGHRAAACDAVRELVHELRRDVAWGREPRSADAPAATSAVSVGEAAYQVTVPRPGPSGAGAAGWPPALLPVLVERVAAAPAGDRQATAGLSRRELQVARELADGHTTAQAAAALGISVHTARHHAERVYAKLGVRSRAELGALLAAGRRPTSPRAAP